MRFVKYHGLGNDYLVLPDVKTLTPGQIRQICDRHRGVGCDGALLPQTAVTPHHFPIRIFNPDGSEAEKSGNGLRIFARYLWDEGLVGREPFVIETAVGPVTAQIMADGRAIRVEMGQVSFRSGDIPVAGPAREVLNESLTVQGETFPFSAAAIGNPHCVIFTDDPTPEMAQKYGPDIEWDGRFPHRANVQFVQVLDRQNLRLEIWERGAGYTLASGSSSCAAAAVAHKLGLCAAAVTVHMPGGPLAIAIAPDFTVTMTGPVTPVCQGVIAPEMFGG